MLSQLLLLRHTYLSWDGPCGVTVWKTPSTFIFFTEGSLYSQRRILGENEALSDSIKSFNSKWVAHLSNEVLVCILRRESLDETLLVCWPYGRPFSQCYTAGTATKVKVDLNWFINNNWTRFITIITKAEFNYCLLYIVLWNIYKNYWVKCE